MESLEQLVPDIQNKIALLQAQIEKLLSQINQLDLGILESIIKEENIYLKHHQIEAQEIIDSYSDYLKMSENAPYILTPIAWRQYLNVYYTHMIQNMTDRRKSISDLKKQRLHMIQLFANLNQVCNMCKYTFSMENVPYPIYDKLLKLLKETFLIVNQYIKSNYIEDLEIVFLTSPKKPVSYYFELVHHINKK